MGIYRFVDRVSAYRLRGCTPDAVQLAQDHAWNRFPACPIVFDGTVIKIDRPSRGQGPYDAYFLVEFEFVEKALVMICLAFCVVMTG